MAYIDKFETEDTQLISLLVQDPVYYVRQQFVERICRYAANGHLPCSFTILLVLVAHEPEPTLKEKAKNFIIRQAKNQRSEGQELLEHEFVRLIHLLAHHPDFSREEEDVKLFESYLDFFIDAVATSENVSYIYYMSGQLKMVRDRSSENSEVDNFNVANLYIE